MNTTQTFQHQLTQKRGFLHAVEFGGSLGKPVLGLVQRKIDALGTNVGGVGVHTNSSEICGVGGAGRCGPANRIGGWLTAHQSAVEALDWLLGRDAFARKDGHERGSASDDQGETEEGAHGLALPGEAEMANKHAAQFRVGVSQLVGHLCNGLGRDLLGRTQRSGCALFARSSGSQCIGGSLLAGLMRKLGALVANGHSWPGDHLGDFVLVFAAEIAEINVFGFDAHRLALHPGRLGGRECGAAVAHSTLLCRPVRQWKIVQGDSTRRKLHKDIGQAEFDLPPRINDLVAKAARGAGLQGEHLSLCDRLCEVVGFEAHTSWYPKVLL